MRSPMTEKLKTLAEVLFHPNALRWSDALYADPDCLVDPRSFCLVLDPDGVDTDEEDEPAEAKKRGFSYILSIQDIQSIYANLEAHVAIVQAEQMIAAFLYYVEQDAFTTVNRSANRT